MKYKTQILYSLQQILYWMTYCVLIGFASVYLIGKGFKDFEIGLLLAGTNLTSVFLQFLITHTVVTKTSIHRVLQVMFGAMLALSFALYLSEDIVIVNIATFTILQTLLMTLLPYINSLGLSYEDSDTNVDFSVARGFGSMGFAVASFAIGKFLTLQGIKVIPIISPIFLGLLFLVVTFSPKDKTLSKTEVSAKSGNFFSRYPKFVFFLISLALVFTYHNFINAYLPQIMTSVGGDSAAVGVALMVGGLCELPAMFMYSKLTDKKSHSFWVMVSLIAYCFRSLVLVLVTSVLQVQTAQLLQGISFALLLPSVSYYLQNHLKPSDQVYGQTLFTIAMTLGGVLGNLVGGFTIDLYGIKGMLMLGLVLCIVSTASMFYAIKNTSLNNKRRVI